MAVAVAISFDAGILLYADATHSAPSRIPIQFTKIFPKTCGANHCGRSIFLIAEPDDQTAAALHCAERMLRVIEPADCTIDRMRTTIEDSLLEVSQRNPSQAEPMQGCTLMAALYSPIDRQCALFRTSGVALREFVGYDCQGPAAYLGHHFIRDRYRAAQSMGSLNLSTAFAIGADALEAVRTRVHKRGDCIEVVVMYSNGHASDVQCMRPNTRRERTLGLLGALRTR